MTGLRVAACTVLVATCLGCSTTPRLSEATGTQNNDVYVGDVVNRIKCELAYAFGDKFDDPSYAWLRDWTVKTDLTLQANDQGALAVSGSGARYFDQAVNKQTYGTASQFFSLGVTGGVGEQAMLSETVSFTLSANELTQWRKSSRTLFEQTCAPGGQTELLGHLGLQEWIDAALSPVSAHELLAGKHPAPGGGAAKAPQLTPKPQGAPGAGKKEAAGEANKLNPQQLAQLIAAYNDASAAAAGAMNTYNSIAKALQQAESTEKTVQSIHATYQGISTPTTVQKLDQEVNAARHAVSNIRYAQQCAKAQLCGDAYGDCLKFGYGKAGDGAKATGSLDPPTECQKMSQSLCPEYPQDPMGAVVKASGAITQFVCVRGYFNDVIANPEQTFPNPNAVAVAAQDAAARTKVYGANIDAISKYVNGIVVNYTVPDPPIDSLGHQVEFVINYNVAVAPSWTLAAFKGPSLGGPLFGVGTTRTQLLQLALGPTTPATPASAEQNRIITNQTILLSRPQ